MLDGYYCKCWMKVEQKLNWYFFIKSIYISIGMHVPVTFTYIQYLTQKGILNNELEKSHLIKSIEAD